MIYVVFALITAAAVAYLYFNEARPGRGQAEPVDERRTRLNERRDVIKHSLKDLEYERSVGKIDAENFARLENGFLAEWDQIEEELKNLPEARSAQEAAQDKCPACGSAILTASARFCHACGGRLAQVLAAVVFFGLLAGGNALSAFDIRVTVNNATAGRIEATPLDVQLLKLEKGMQPVTKKTALAGKVEFLALPEMTSGPYMVQAEYRGVTYNKVIPPNVQSPADVTLDIFENTTSTEKLRVRTLMELRRADKDSIAGLLIFFFVNRDNKTFTGGKTGAEFYLPPGAEIGQASVSVGSGSSNIQWLKLQPQKSDRPNVYSSGQNIKPGERILQVTFRLPYAEKGTVIDFRSLYPQDAGIQLIAEPDDMLVTMGEKTLSRVMDESLGRGLIGFRPHETAIQLRLSGGGVAQAIQREEAEIEVLSPLSPWQKLVFPFAALGIFLLVALIRRRAATP